MIKFSNACRKDCPWLILPSVEGPISYYCDAFNMELDTDDDPDSKGIHKCEECLKVSDPEKTKDASIDSIVHSMAIMAQKMRVNEKLIRDWGWEVKETAGAFAKLGESLKSANLKSLINNDPNS